jgi:hypothetical protein
MSSPTEQPKLVLIERLPNGKVKWIPLEFLPPLHVPVASDVAYTLVDRSDYEAPTTLETQRRDGDLVVNVDGTEVLVLEGFFTTAAVAFYPTTNIAGGAGPFSGSPLTPESPMQASSPDVEQAVSSAASYGGIGEHDAISEKVGGGGPGSGSSPLLWVGLGAGGLGLLALAGGGGGSGGGESSGSGGGPVTDTVPPQITSSATAPGVAENSGPGQVVYTATATDAGTITYSLKPVNDAAAFSINATTGAVTLTGNPDFETKPSYTFTVVATDSAGNSAERAVTLAVSNVNDSGPITITSGATANAINENSGPQQVVYTAVATGTGAVTYSLKAGGDAAAFSIDANTGAVTLTANPDDEAKGSYTFTVVARDAAGNSGERTVSLEINDLDEVAPTITSSATANAINENSGAGQVAYTVTSTDTGDVSTGSTTYSLKPVDDSSAFSIDTNTGAVRLTSNPDFETKSSYNFTVVATDSAGNSAERAVALAVSNVNETVDVTAPTVDNIALSALGAQNGILNAGDTVRVTVTMSENTQVDTSGGVPSIELSIDHDKVDAGYVSGSGTRNLIFEYTIRPGDEDKNGISIRPDTLESNGGSLADAAGNIANLSHGPVANDPDLIVDTTAKIVLAMSDNTQLDLRMEQLLLASFRLADSKHDTSRAFESAMSEKNDIRVALADGGLHPTQIDSSIWNGSANLGSDDRVAIVSSDADLQAPLIPTNQLAITDAAVSVAWQSSADPPGLEGVVNSTHFGVWMTDATDDGGGDNHVNPNSFAEMPVVIVTTQGLV